LEKVFEWEQALVPLSELVLEMAQSHLSELVLLLATELVLEMAQSHPRRQHRHQCKTRTTHLSICKPTTISA
jgi:hypothetical protein